MDIRKLAYWALGDRYTRLARKSRDLRTLFYSVSHPYHYEPGRYEGTFLERQCELSFEKKLPKRVEKVIYVFWTGENEITPNRLAGIRSLQNVSQVRVQLITPENLQDYIVKDDPLPEAYKYLSLIHRSDFLRGYFMYYYGGGYADIKTYYRSWIPAFNKLEASDEAYAVGYPEVGFEGAANQGITHKNLKEDLYHHWHHLIGNGAFICRPHTQFTAEWYSEAKRRLVTQAEVLKLHPAQDIFGTNGDYPLPWASIQGEIFHPLCLKYHDRLLKDKALMPSFENYR